MTKQVMLYGSTIWSNCSADNLTRVLKLQNRAARVILGADTRSNSVNLFNKLEWLPFYDEVKVNKCSLVLKRLQGSCPGYMYDLLKCNADLHARSGRYSALNLVCPRYNRESDGGRTFSVSAIRFWNSLPTNLKKGISVTLFRKATYSHFLTRYNDVDHFDQFKCNLNCISQYNANRHFTINLPLARSILVIILLQLYFVDMYFKDIL